MQICTLLTNTLHFIFILPINLKHKVARWSTSKQIHLAIVGALIAIMRDALPQRTNFFWRLNWWTSFIALVKWLSIKCLKSFLNYLSNQMLNANIMELMQYRSQLTLQLYEIIYLTPELYFWLCVTVSPS